MSVMRQANAQSTTSSDVHPKKTSFGAVFMEANVVLHAWGSFYHAYRQSSEVGGEINIFEDMKQHSSLSSFQGDVN